MAQNETIIIEDAKLLFRNFAGREREYNSEGDRNFCILLDPDRAADLKAKGLNVKQLKPREEGVEPDSYLQVKVNYAKGRPPRCVLITSRGRTELGADEVEIFDAADIKTADVIINPYHWTVRENSGVKAYLKTIFVTVNEDELEQKYADLQDANTGLAPLGPVDED